MLSFWYRHVVYTHVGQIIIFWYRYQPCWTTFKTETFLVKTLLKIVSKFFWIFSNLFWCFRGWRRPQILIVLLWKLFSMVDFVETELEKSPIKLLVQICCLYSCWIQILSFWYRYVVYTDVGYKCQVMSIHVMAIIPSFLILSAQVSTLWRFSPRF